MPLMHCIPSHLKGRIVLLHRDQLQLVAHRTCVCLHPSMKPAGIMLDQCQINASAYMHVPAPTQGITASAKQGIQGKEKPCQADYPPVPTHARKHGLEGERGCPRQLPSTD